MVMKLEVMVLDIDEQRRGRISLGIKADLHHEPWEELFCTLVNKATKISGAISLSLTYSDVHCLEAGIDRSCCSSNLDLSWDELVRMQFVQYKKGDMLGNSGIDHRC